MALSAANLQEVIKQQNEFLESLTETACVYGVMIGHDGKEFVVATSQGEVRCKPFEDIVVGDTVALIKQSYQIHQRAARDKFLGMMAELKQKVDEERWFVDIDGASKVIATSHRLKEKLTPGARVVLDQTNSIIVDLLPQEKSEFVTHSTSVKWEDIGGQNYAKAELKNAIALIRGGNAIFDAYGAKPPKGVLFYGPPGNGKTMLGKAAASELAADGDGAFMYVKAPEILNKYVGDSEGKIRSLFKAARNYKLATGKSAVIFIDEADAILQKRGTGVSSDVEKTIVPAFLTEMDGLEDSSALVILATNRPDTLDPAVTRDGRIDRRIKIDKPDSDTIKLIFGLNLRSLPSAEGHTVDQLCVDAHDHMATFDSMSKFVSGAMIASAVDRAKMRAIGRDVDTKKVSGVSKEDLLAAITEAASEY